MAEDGLVQPQTKSRASRGDEERRFSTPFEINGRFLSQRITGVQRYAREITAALDCLSSIEARAQVVVPAMLTEAPQYTRIPVRPFGPGNGHIWEQFILPWSGAAPLLNFCNLGPVLRRNQVVCLHDANLYNMPESYSLLFRSAYRALWKIIVRRTRILTTVSKFSAADLAHHLPLANKRIHVIPNGHEHVFRWDAVRSHISKRLSFENPYVLLLGSRARHKNVELILKLAPRLEELGLDVVLTGGRNDLFSSTQEIGGRNVHYTGFVEDDDLAYLFKNALCLAFPSLTEGFGLPIIEAMALQCPVISSNRASMPEVCGDAALLVSPDDPDAWFRGIRDMAHSSTLRGELRERGAVRVREYSWRQSAMQYLELVEQLGI